MNRLGPSISTQHLIHTQENACGGKGFRLGHEINISTQIVLLINETSSHEM